jgi:excisionase family DNA binding protein
MTSTPVDLSTPLLTAEQVAELLGLHPRTVLEFARDGRMPCRRFGRRVRFVRTEIEQWLSVAA